MDHKRRWMIGLTVAAVFVPAAGVGESLRTRGIRLMKFLISVQSALSAARLVTPFAALQ
jgi:hypothetical protein